VGACDLCDADGDDVACWGDGAVFGKHERQLDGCGAHKTSGRPGRQASKSVLAQVVSHRSALQVIYISTKAFVCLTTYLHPFSDAEPIQAVDRIVLGKILPQAS
jgi:hypothetical protein